MYDSTQARKYDVIDLDYYLLRNWLAVFLS